VKTSDLKTYWVITAHNISDPSNIGHIEWMIADEESV